SVTGGVTNVAELFKDQGVYLKKAKARGQEADIVALDRLNHYYWPEDNHPALFVFASVAKKLLPRWQSLVYQQWSEGVAADKNPHEKMKDLRVDEFDAFKYAEVAWPDYPRYSAPAKSGTYAWFKGRYRDMSKVGGDLFATSD
ncbi:MAG TPA: hypothetical protein VNA25_14740, partial [Phycisphaerae bacterium]|nr:hypothetical protein [Phycisphaerae bacterium]